MQRLLKWLPYVAAAMFLIYISLTALQIAPQWSALAGAESFSIAKHLVVLAAISIYLCINPRFGSWIALAWGVLVPFERYTQLFSELFRGSLATVFAPLDVTRLVLLLLATCLAGLSAVVITATGKTTAQSTASNADA